MWWLCSVVNYYDAIHNEFGPVKLPVCKNTKYCSLNSWMSFSISVNSTLSLTTLHVHFNEHLCRNKTTATPVLNTTWYHILYLKTTWQKTMTDNHKWSLNNQAQQTFDMQSSRSWLKTSCSWVHRELQTCWWVCRVSEGTPPRQSHYVSLCDRVASLRCWIAQCTSADNITTNHSPQHTTTTVTTASPRC